MKTTKNVVVSVAYELRNDDGILLDQVQRDEPMQYLHGYGELIVGLENALEGRAVGDSFAISIEPDEGYGDYDEGLVQRVPRALFRDVDEMEVGMRFMVDTDQGQLPVEITAVEGDEVVVDANHVLAGQTLHFKVEVIDLRSASDEEIAHGHVHDEDDEHHHIH